MHKFTVKFAVNASFTVKLTVKRVISILKILRRKQVKIKRSIICHRKLAPKSSSVYS